MARGVMSWFDPHSGEGRVRRRSREFVVRTGDVEPSARAPGARVTFDLDDPHGAARAVNVRLRRGRRTSHRQSGFGDLVGAHHPDQKGHGASRRRPDLPDPADRLEQRPLEVARLWLRAVQRGDVGAVGALYASDVRFHGGGRQRQGLDDARRYVAGSRMRSRHDGAVEASEDGGRFVVRWPARDGRPARRVDLRIEHGQVAEQWER